MARIAGVNIPSDKRLIIALTYIYGIGKTTSSKICKQVSISENTRVNVLSDAQILTIREIVESYKVEGACRRESATNIKQLMNLGCYKGLRHRKRLPVRGQRTHTNARTRKGISKNVIGKRK